MSVHDEVAAAQGYAAAVNMVLESLMEILVMRKVLPAEQHPAFAEQMRLRRDLGEKS